MKQTTAYDQAVKDYTAEAIELRKRRALDDNALKALVQNIADTLWQYGFEDGVNDVKPKVIDIVSDHQSGRIDDDLVSKLEEA